MKKIFTIVAFLISAVSFGQNNNAVVAALKTGDASKLSSYFGPTLDVKLPKQTELSNVSKNDAMQDVSNFFSFNKVTGFALISQREMSGTMYIAGKLLSANTSYNITVMLKQNGSDYNIITLRIN